MASGTHEITTEQAYSNSEIAHQCPLSGGVGVYSARTLFDLLSPGEYYDDEAICLAAGLFYRKAHPEFKIENNIIVYPNPATNNINIRAKFPVLNGLCIIYDLMGKPIVKTNLKSNRSLFSLDISKFNNAVYQIKIYDGSSLIYNYKLIIVK
jgi:hypothetical protein